MEPSIPKLVTLEEELAQRARQQAVVAQLGQRALVGADLQTLLDEAVAAVANTLGVEYCKVLELLPGGDVLLLKAGVGWKDGLVGTATVGTDLDSQAGYTLYAGEPVIVEDLRSESRFHGPALLVEHGVVSGVSVIIQSQQRPYGVLGTHTRAHRTFTLDDVNFLQSVANVLAAAIDRKQVEMLLIQRGEELAALNTELEQRVARRAGFVHLLQQASAAANGVDTAESAFQFVLAQICNHMNWPVGHVFLIEGEGNEARIFPAPIWYLQDPHRFESFQQATMATRLKRGEGLLGRVHASGRPAWFTDVTQYLNFTRKAAAEANGIRAGFAFPVMVGDEVAAVMEFFSTESAEPDRPLLEVMANIGTQIGRVVERERSRTLLLRSNEELRSSQEQLAEAQKIAHIGSWEWHISTGKLHWSDELYRIYGLDPGTFQVTYEDFLNLVHPDDREMVIRVVEQALQDGEPFVMEHRVQRLDGTTCTIYAEGRVEIGEDGRPARMLGIGQDITERLHMENALRESRDMFENLFESAPDGTVLTDEAGRIVRVNRQAERMFGYARDQLMNQPLEMLLPERYQEQHVHHREVFNQDPRTRLMSQRQELYGRRKDGSEFPVDIMISPVQVDGGLQVIAVVRDITGRRRSEEALRQSEARFRSIFEGAALGMALVDLEGRLLVNNPRLSEILGYSNDELRGMNTRTITHPLDLDATQSLYRDLIEGRREAGQVEKRYIRKDGRVIWGALTISLVRNGQGNPHFAIAMVEDITHRKKMEAELAEMQFRLMAGREQERTQLAQELHDVPLQDLYVLLYGLNEFEEAWGDAERLRSLKGEFADGLRNVITTLRSIMGELRSPTLSPFGLAGAIREHADLFASKNPQLKLHLDMMDDEQVLPEDVRLNLFRIYQQALSNVIRHAQASHVNVRLHYDEHWVRLEIEDDGLGFVVPPRWIGLAREGHLGLAGSAERAEIIGGHFQVISAPGRGARIRVEVPREKEENLLS